MDIDGTIQFIINQQAQFVADIHLLQQSQRELGIRVDNLTGHMEKLTGTVEKLTGTVEELTGTVGTLAAMVAKVQTVLIDHKDAFIVTEGMISKVASTLTDHVERQGWLFDAHQRTEAKLDTFVGKMDGFIDEMRRNFEGRNGKRNDA